jgi:predicted RNA-binding Zn-ribbon protein involved in translation (DUF1610 family)
MRFLYKKCEVCGVEINKLQKWWNIYMLKAGTSLKCPHCGTEYKTNNIISIFGSWYSFLGWIFPMLLIVYFLDSFKLDLGIEVWLYAFFLYSLMEFLVMVILPLKKIDIKK